MFYLFSCQILVYNGRNYILNMEEDKMCDNNKKDGGSPNIDIAELIIEKVNFNIQSSDSRPLDMELMTGRNESSNKGSEKK